MSETTYTWRKGFPTKCDPQDVGLELEALYRVHGNAVSTDTLVEHARSEGSVLHQHFTWDDTEAAVQWRRQQARQILNSIRVTYAGDSQPRVMNVSVRIESGNAYQKATVAVQSTTLWAQVMIDTLRDLSGVEKRLEELYHIERGVRQQHVAEIRDRIGAAREAAEQASRV